MVRFKTSAEMPRWITTWLFVVMVLVVVMIALGGATRLTNSGLSITEWLPIRGAIPPLSNQAWLNEFDKYKQIPEFLAEHPDMELSGFKFIYFWMVYSGLQDGQVSVSQYRLAAHLGLAFIIVGFLYWAWRGSKERWPARTFKVSFKSRTLTLAVLIYVQIISGAFVAGTQAGKSYNTWPLMDGGFVPEGYFIMSPVWRNFFENIPAIQFNHRIFAYLVLAMSIWVFLSTRNRHIAVHRKSANLLFLVALQVVLGIWTLLSGATLILSLLHQFTAIFVFLTALAAARVARVQST